MLFTCPIRKLLRPQQVLDQGKIKRVRGVAWATRVSPAVANRMIEAAKGVLLKFLPDVYIYADHFTGAKAGKSPGFGLTLTAETTTGAFLSAEVISKTVDNSGPKKEPTVPEDLGVQGAYALLEEVYRYMATLLYGNSISHKLAAYVATAEKRKLLRPLYTTKCATEK